MTKLDAKKPNRVMTGAAGEVRPGGELDPEIVAQLRKRVAANYYDDPRVVELLAWAILLGCMQL